MSEIHVSLPVFIYSTSSQCYLFKSLVICEQLALLFCYTHRVHIIFSIAQLQFECPEITCIITEVIIFSLVCRRIMNVNIFIEEHDSQT